MKQKLAKPKRRPTKLVAEPPPKLTHPHLYRADGFDPFSIPLDKWNEGVVFDRPAELLLDLYVPPICCSYCGKMLPNAVKLSLHMRNECPKKPKYLEADKKKWSVPGAS